MSNVATQSSAVQAMQADLILAAALMGGTRAMRAAGETYLPKWPNEDAESYKTRLATSVLFPAFKRTVFTLAGKPFSKPLTMAEDVPPQLVEWAEDIDLEGRNLHTFAHDLMKCALAQGLCGILVDYPVKPEGVRTQADERVAGLRPYFVHIKPEQLIGWISARVAGKWVIRQLRILETVQEPAGDFATKEVQQVRVLEPGKWATYRQDPKKPDEWILEKQGVTSLAYVPFIPVYGDREGFMAGKSPLVEVAHMNVEHWQSASDQRTILHVARVPILTIIGIDDDKFQLTLGASAAVKLPLGGDMKYVEHTGAAITAGQNDLDKLEERMRQAGAELLVVKPMAVTATQVSTENAVGMCALQSIASGLEDAIDSGLQMMADWAGLQEGGHVALFDDYASNNLSDASAQLLVNSQQAGLISKVTTINELKRRGILSAEVKPEDEAAAVEGEGPALGTIGGTGNEE
jgi:hypothetical protein